MNRCTDSGEHTEPLWWPVVLTMSTPLAHADFRQHEPDQCTADEPQNREDS